MTTVEFFVPKHPERIPFATHTRRRNELFAIVREALGSQRGARDLSQAERLDFLARAVPVLAQFYVSGGLHPDIATEHASMVIESMFLADALCDTPGLCVLFDD